jgi:hypothetical protein
MSEEIKKETKDKQSFEEQVFARFDRIEMYLKNLDESFKRIEENEALKLKLFDLITASKLANSKTA